MICKHRNNWRFAFPCILPISAQIFGFKSSDLYFLPFQYTLCVGFILYIKAAPFKALKQHHLVIVIILPSEQEQFGFGGSFLFFDVSSAKAILPDPALSSCAPVLLLPLPLQCTNTAADVGRLPCFSRASFARKRGKYGHHPLLP